MSPLPFDAPAVAHGLGLFETLRVLGGRVPGAAAHWERLRASAAALELPVPSQEAFDRALAAALGSEDGPGEAALRVVWACRRPPLDDPAGWELGCLRMALPAVTVSRREHGRVLVLDSSWRRSMPRYKSTSYAVCALAARMAFRRGADEALFVDDGGSILEGTATNVFAVRGRVLVTPPVAAGLLPGITRDWVLAHAPRVGCAVEEGPVTREDLKRGGFLAGTLTTLAPIRHLDGGECADPGESYRALVALFRQQHDQS